MKIPNLTMVNLTMILMLSSACAATEPSPTTLPPPMKATPTEPSPTTLPPPTKATPTQTPQPTEIPGTSVRLTILYDNTTEDPRLTVEWGFSALVEYMGHTVLFDTGLDGPSLLGNMEVLGVNPEVIEVVVLSHEHGDHTGGLHDLLATGIRPDIYIPAAMAGLVTQYQREQYTIIEVSDPVEIIPGIFSTGEISGSVPEQGLVVETSEGIVVITGCAHPGIVRMVQQASEIVDSEIALVIGGFHLGGKNSSYIDTIIADFRRMGVKQVTPTHCTGENQIAQIGEAYGEDYIPGGAGRVIVIGDTAP
jgi:7,8-dihydropterin-6-yl-methyl-4-(beta-D-ribofuranosyl)aminobenzene 5'-phosphate synthase